MPENHIVPELQHLEYIHSNQKCSVTSLQTLSDDNSKDRRKKILIYRIAIENLKQTISALSTIKYKLEPLSDINALKKLVNNSVNFKNYLHIQNECLKEKYDCYLETEKQQQSHIKKLDSKIHILLRSLKDPKLQNIYKEHCHSTGRNDSGTNGHKNKHANILDWSGINF